MKTIFITGASSGVGKATAEYFADNGWQVIATMRNLAKGEDLAKSSNIEIMELDVTNPEQIHTTSQEALSKYDIDVLFNNAGYGLMAPLEVSTEQEIRDNIETNVIGTMLVTKEFIPHFKKRKKGAILTTSSLAGVIALPLDGVYGAAKRAITSMSESIYYELKPFGVAVKVMLPGGINTPFKIQADLSGYESSAANQRKWLLDGNEEFPPAGQTVEVIFEAATDGKDKIHYPTDSISQKLYDEYMSTNIEDYKNKFYEMWYEGK